MDPAVLEVGDAGRGGGRGGSDLPPIEYKVYLNPEGGVEEDYPLDAHVLTSSTA